MIEPHEPRQLPAGIDRKAAAGLDPDAARDASGGNEHGAIIHELGVVCCTAGGNGHAGISAIDHSVVRHAAGFDIEPATYEAIKTLAPTLEKISAERIQVEIVKLVTSAHPERIRDVYETGLTKRFFPEFDDMMECEQVNKHHMYSVGEHTIVSMGLAPEDKVVRLTMLLHDIAKPACKTTDEAGQNHFKTHPVKGADMARTVLRRLKFDNDTTDKVCNLVRNHDDRPEINKRNVRRMIIRVGQENFLDLIAVKKADCLAQSMYHREEKLAYIHALEREYNEIVAAGDCLRIKDLEINGKDLIAMGIPQGQRIGEVLKAVFDEVVDNPQLNKRETLLTMAKNMIE